MDKSTYRDRSLMSCFVRANYFVAPLIETLWIVELLGCYIQVSFSQGGIAACPAHIHLLTFLVQIVRRTLPLQMILSLSCIRRQLDVPRAVLVWWLVQGCRLRSSIF